MAHETLVFNDNKLAPVLFGQENNHLKRIEKELNIDISNRGNEITITGDKDKIDQAKMVLEALWSKLQQGQDVDIQTVDSALRFLDDQKSAAKSSPKKQDTQNMAGFITNKAIIETRKKTIEPRSPTQAKYIEAMYNNQLVFGVGPAGTGKTYLAIAMAVAMLEAGRVERIILSRPALEAGEKIGFLPGELRDKMDPYMRPLYDALYDVVAHDKINKQIISEEIEIAPLAFMRGRSLNNAFVILDEAQNSTSKQMLMFLTRLGNNSRMVITGDPGQIDLGKGEVSGLVESRDILQGVDDVGFIQFETKDVVRSKLVGRIIDAYDQKRGISI